MNDFGDLFGKLDISRVTEAVDLIWDNRDELGAIIEAARKAPEMLSRIASGLSDAGEQATTASVALVGKDGRSGAQATLTSGAGALGNVAERLGDAARFIADIAGEVGKVSIPTFEATYTEVVGIKVLSGVDVGNEPVLAGPADRLADTAASIVKATGDLTKLADNLVELAKVMGAAGVALGRVGDHLEGTGTEARAFFGGTAPATRTAPAKRTPAKRTPAKRPPAAKPARPAKPS